MERLRSSKSTHAIKKFALSLKEEQVEAKEVIEKNAITVLWGGAGTGKTLVAVYTALSKLQEKEIGRIIITRPTVSDEDLGFLPGDIKDKMDPWLSPIYENITNVIGPENMKALMDHGLILIKPVSYLRGNTFVNSFIIVDEAQNVTKKQMEMIVTRLGRKSKMVICGDLRQVDLKKYQDTGLQQILEASEEIEGLANVRLTNNYRHPVVEKLLDFYEK